MKTMKWTLLLAFFAIWACQEEQFSQEEVWKDSSSPSPRVERLRTIKRVDNAPATRAVSVKDKLWQPGDTIRIKFQNADEYPGMSDKVIQYAAIWLQYAYLHFEYVDKDEEADVKIGFNMDTRELAWSTIGTDCKQVPQDDVSLNFYDLEYEEEPGIKSEILKGFGHILGLGFEHKNPNDDQLVFINDEVKDYYNLSDQDVIELTQLYNTDQTNYTDYDPESIMTLEIPKKILTKPTQKYRTYRNNELSNLDTIHIAELYPFPIEPEPADSCIAVINIHESSATIFAVVSSDIEIDWGNGQKELITAEDSKNYPKGVDMSYGGIGDFTIKIYGAESAISDLSIICYNVLSLDISKNKLLERFACQQSNLSSLNVSQNTKLKFLSCNQNNLNQLDVTNNKELDALDCAENNLTYIDLNENKKLRYLDISKNKLTVLNTENLIDLKDINASYNSLHSIDVHNNPNLWSLFIRSNYIETLDVTNNHKLINLEIDNNSISNINLSNNLDLLFLTCKNNKLRSLNIYGLNLVELDIQNNPIPYQETKNIFRTINDRNHTSNGRIRFPLYCYRDSLTNCNVYDHAKCDRKEITRELAELFKTKHWIYAHENNSPIPYTNDQLRNLEIKHSNFQKNIRYKNYFQQLRIERFGYNQLLQ